MKVSIILISLLMSLSAFASSFQVDVMGMSCGMCVDKVSRDLKATEKVENISVSLNSKQEGKVSEVNFTESKNKMISIGEIKTIFKNNGYEVVKIRRL